MSSHGWVDKGEVLMAAVHRLTKGKSDSRFLKKKKASLNHKAVKSAASATGIPGLRGEGTQMV